MGPSLITVCLYIRFPPPLDFPRDSQTKGVPFILVSRGFLGRGRTYYELTFAVVGPRRKIEDVRHFASQTCHQANDTGRGPGRSASMFRPQTE